MKRLNYFKNKKAIVSNYLIWLLIGMAILAIVMITMFMLKGKGISIIDKIKNLLRFG